VLVPFHTADRRYLILRADGQQHRDPIRIIDKAPLGRRRERFSFAASCHGDGILRGVRGPITVTTASRQGNCCRDQSGDQRKRLAGQSIVLRFHVTAFQDALDAGAPAPDTTCSRPVAGSVRWIAGTETTGSTT